MKKILILLMLITVSSAVFADSKTIQFVKTSSRLQGGFYTIIDLKLEVICGDYGVNSIKVLGYRNNKSWSSGNVYTPCNEGDCQVSPEEEEKAGGGGTVRGYSIYWAGQKLYFKLN